MAKETLKNISIKTGVQQRPPIVVVMGHVDHGKTSLLDYIRKANIAAREAGGITQATAAYEIVHTPTGGGEARKMTFIDTPGHEAFTAMRSRGARVADLAILVVAADEGVKPQTKEAIKIIEEAKTPFVVAITKVDKTSGNVDKARNDLMAAGVMFEGYGGQVSYHAVSSKTGEGVNDLLDLLLLAADLENLTYDASAPASGFVLEASRDPKRGIEVAVIVKNGTLSRGDTVRTATASGKVKILEDFLGKTVSTLEPSAPAIVIGLENIPKVGEEFSAGDIKEGIQAAPVRSTAGLTLNQLSKSKPDTLNLILKAGDAGSLEALSVVLRGIDQKGGKEINIIDEGVGDITDGDVRHAIATKATLIGFKNRVEKGAKVLADAQTVTIITSEIVYDLSTAVEEFFSGARGPAASGSLEVLAVFNQEKPQKQLVGGRVTDGTFRPKTSVDIVRGPAGTTPVGNGKILSLREKKSEIFQADNGKEIGVLLDSQTIVQVGDKLVIRK
ncbi:MAG TPA: translation initiation factor IF-2 [Candidatus Paceibacterota bacterium]|nr:translation initiation factor IF-2 [Candidatus Paceibacterota bacterium]